jgi:hypothetical protein
MVKLNLEVREGLQYRMDKLEIFGPAEIAEKLQMRWELPIGAPYDASYVTTFLEKNNSLLPERFSPTNGVGVFLDCRDATVSVHLHLTQDPQHAIVDGAKHVDCAASPEGVKDESHGEK